MLFNKAGFILTIVSSLSHMHISVFEVISVYPIDRYQNTIPTAMLLYELKKVHLQERFKFMTHSIGRLRTLCISVLSLSGGMESE